MHLRWNIKNVFPWVSIFILLSKSPCRVVSHDKEYLKTYPVDDENLVEFELESELLGGDGDRVEETEAHGLCHLGVVARRPDDGKAVLQLSRRHLERKLDDRTCSLCGNKKCGMRGNCFNTILLPLPLPLLLLLLLLIIIIMFSS